MASIHTIQPGDNIQSYLDLLHETGGGILYLNPTDTFNINNDLNWYSNIVLNGNGAIMDFGGTAYGIKIIGTNLDNLVDCGLQDLTITNTTGTGIDIQYASNPILNILDNVLVNNCNIGVSIDNSFAPGIIGTFSNNGINCQISNTDSIETHFCAFSDSTSGDGLILNNCTSSTIFDTGADDNFGNGISLIDCSGISFISLGTQQNGEDGIKLISGNLNIKLNDIEIVNNGGYGINIEDASNQSTIISINNFDGNASGAVNDLGTGTIIKSNHGVADSPVLSLDTGGTGTSLSDPNANSLWGWDDTDNAIKFFNLGTGLSYDHSTHTISAPDVGTVTSVSGTTNRITSTGGSTPIIDISASYVGQSSITTVGTITTGIWNGTSIANANLANSSLTIGSTNIALGATSTTLAGLTSITSTTFVGALTGNATTATALATGRTISISGDLTYTSPSFDGSGNVTAAGTLATVNSNVGTFGSATQSTQITANGKGLITAIANVAITPAASSITGGQALTKTDDTNVTLTLGGTPLTALLTASSLTLGWTGTLSGTRGGTGVNNGAKTFTYLKNISFTAADDTGVYTLPTGTKTLLAIDGAGTSLTGIPYALTGTANQVILSAGTGNITFSLPQSIATSSTVSFASLATSAASPLLLTNGQLVTVSLTSQTVGGTTLTIPNFASVSDTFTFNTLAATLLNKTLDTSVGKGTWTASGTWTLPAHTVGGTLTISAQNIATDTTTGTKFGTATNQKISFYNSTPIVQPTGDVITGLQNLGLMASATITATTNANLTGPITSVGNATSIASQTGTGTKFVVDTSPTIVTPTFTTSFVSPLWKPASDSTTALQMTASNGTTVLINVDSTNSRIGFAGVTAPVYTLDIGTSFAGETSMVATNTDNGTASFAGIGTKNRVGSSAICRFLCMGTGWTTTGAFLQDSGLIQVGAAITNGLSILTSNAAGSIRFYTGGQNLRATINSTGGLDLVNKITTYNNIATVSNGIPSEVATIDSTGLTANVGATLLYAVPSSGAGQYQVCSLVVETTAGSLSSTLPNVQIVYTDNDTGGTITIDATPILGIAGIGQTGALTANTVGTTSTGVIVINAKASTNINYQTVNYASNLAGMAYALHIKLIAH